VHVTVANQLLERAGCTARAAWNAQLCPGPYAALTLRNQDAHPSQLGPVKLTRSSGQVHTLYGTPRTGANTHFRSVVPLGYDYAYDFGPATSGKFTLELSEAAPADTLLVSLPYAGQAPFVYRDWWIDQRSLLDSYPSLAALSGAPDTGYYHDGRRLYLKLVVQDRNDWAHLTVCRRAGCP
jgi:cell migration-inducing and hyaluronan-binding protein